MHMNDVDHLQQCGTKSTNFQKQQRWRNCAHMWPSKELLDLISIDCNH